MNATAPQCPKCGKSGVFEGTHVFSSGRENLMLFEPAATYEKDQAGKWEFAAKTVYIEHRCDPQEPAQAKEVRAITRESYLSDVLYKVYDEMAWGPCWKDGCAGTCQDKTSECPYVESRHDEPHYKALFDMVHNAMKVAESMDEAVQ